MRFHALPKGKREEKFEALAKVSLDGPGWDECATGWREPFLPSRVGAWATFPALADFFVLSRPRREDASHLGYLARCSNFEETLEDAFSEKKT